MSETAGDDTFEQEDHGIVGFGRILGNLDTVGIRIPLTVTKILRDYRVPDTLQYHQLWLKYSRENILQNPGFTQVPGEVFVSGRLGVGIPNN
jgi:hypothetical protein